MNSLKKLTTVILILGCVLSQALWAHAMPKNQSPGAGAELTQSPPVVSITFNAQIEPKFSKLIVTDRNKKQVSIGYGTVDPNHYILTTKLKSLNKGHYVVSWHVIAHDGHETRGSYSFTIQ